MSGFMFASLLPVQRSSGKRVRRPAPLSRSRSTAGRVGGRRCGSISGTRSRACTASCDVVHQEPRLPVLDHLAAGAEVHGDHGHAGRIGFRQHQSESLRDRVQVQAAPGRGRTMHSCPPRPRARRIRICRFRCGSTCSRKYVLILDDAGDQQRQPTPLRNLDRQVDALVRVDPAEKDQIIAAGFLKRVQREVDSVIDRRQVVQPRRAIGVADRDEVSVTILLIDRHDSGRRESVNGCQDRRLHQPGVRTAP